MDDDDKPNNGGSSPPTADELSKWPLRDLVTSYKGALRRGEPLPSSLTAAFKSRGTANLYPYTKGPDFGNEGLGYGDLVRVSLLCHGASNGDARSLTNGHALAPKTHIARRTRSGMTPLEEDTTPSSGDRDVRPSTPPNTARSK